MWWDNSPMTDEEEGEDRLVVIAVAENRMFSPEEVMMSLMSSSDTNLFAALSSMRKEIPVHTSFSRPRPESVRAAAK